MLSDGIHGGRIVDYEQFSGLSRRDIIDFSANINPLGPPVSVMNAISNALHDIVHYPDASHRRVKSVLANRHAVHERNVLCGNGATEVLELFFRHILPKRTWIIHPAFSEYTRIAKRYHSQVMDITLPIFDDLNIVFSAILKQVLPGDIVILNNPNNPTGRLFMREEWQQYAKQFEQLGVWLLIDESFMDFIEDSNRYTAVPFTLLSSHLVVVGSATKMYAIPGLRFGFAVGHEDLITEIGKNRDGWSVNHLAQIAVEAAYSDDSFLNRTFEWLKLQQEYVQTIWRPLTVCTVLPTRTNFFLAQFKGVNMENLLFRLASEGLFVRSCANFMGLGDNYVRIAIRTREQNERLAFAVNELCRFYFSSC